VARAFALLDRLVRWLALLAGGVLVVLAVLTVYAVVRRYVFNDPMLGSHDISKMMLLLGVFLGLAYCGRSGGHVAVDLFTNMMSQRIVRWTDAFVRLVAAAMLGVLAWRATVAAGNAAMLLEATEMLNIAHAPFHWVIAAGSGLYALVLLLEALCFMAGREPPETLDA